MNAKVSLLFFGIPTLGMLIVFYLVLPWLEKLNLTPFERLVLIITVPMALLFASAIIIYKLQNRNGSLGGFLDCFRLRKIQLADVWWGLGLFGFIVFRREDSHLKEREGRSPESRWEMNRLRTRDGYLPSRLSDCSRAY